MTNWILLLGVALLGPCVEVGGIVSIGTPFLVIGCYFRSLQFHKRTFHMTLGLPGVLAIAYFLCVMMSVFWSPALIAGGFRASYHILGFILFLSLQQRENIQSDYDRIQFWTSALTCAGLVIALEFLMLMGLLAIQGRLGEAFADRITGGLMSLKWAGSNTIAAALLTALYPGLILPGTKGRLAQCAIGAMLLAILATLSRNASVCVMVSVVTYACLSGRAASTLSALTGIGVVLCAGLWMLDADVFDFIVASRVESGDSESFNGRNETWGAAWSEICQRWPAPVGYYGSISTLGHTPHNLILTDMLELGVWGLMFHIFLFVSIAGSLFRARLRRKRMGQSSNDLNILLGGLFGTFINLQFEDPQYTQPYIVCNWIFMGICVAAARLPNDFKVHFASRVGNLAVAAPRTSHAPRPALRPVVYAARTQRTS